MHHIHIYKSKQAIKQPWHFVIKAKNGKVLVTSENYTTYKGCHNGISALIELMLTDKDGYTEVLHGVVEPKGQ